MGKATVMVKVHGLPLEVDIAYAPAYRGERDCYGAPLTPDDPVEVTVEEVRLAGWEIMDVMSDEAIRKTRDAVIKEGRG